MKKYHVMRAVLVFILLLSILSFAGCKGKSSGDGLSASEVTKVSQLVENGYVQSWLSYGENMLQVEYCNPDHTNFILAQCAMTEDEVNVLLELDSLAEDYETQCAKYMDQIGGLTFVSLNDRMPAETEYQAFVGKTVAELEAAGYEQTSVGTDDDGVMFFEYSDANYELIIYTEEKFESLFDLEGVDIEALVIGQVTFGDFVNLDIE